MLVFFFLSVSRLQSVCRINAQWSDCGWSFSVHPWAEAHQIGLETRRSAETATLDFQWIGLLLIKCDGSGSDTVDGCNLHLPCEATVRNWRHWRPEMMASRERRRQFQSTAARWAELFRRQLPGAGIWIGRRVRKRRQYIKACSQDTWPHSEWTCTGPYCRFWTMFLAKFRSVSDSSVETCQTLCWFSSGTELATRAKRNPRISPYHLRDL